MSQLDNAELTPQEEVDRLAYELAENHSKLKGAVMDKHYFQKPIGSSPYCAVVQCGFPASAECHNLLTEEEADLVVGAIPLQALSEELLPCPFCSETPTVTHGSMAIYVRCSNRDCEASTASFLFANWNTRANSQLLTALVEALQRIERWFGEFPDTRRAWDDGSPMSYAACFGTNGERDYMRSIAREALATLNPPLTQLPLQHTELKAEREDG